MVKKKALYYFFFFVFHQLSHACYHTHAHVYLSRIVFCIVLLYTRTTQVILIFVFTGATFFLKFYSMFNYHHLIKQQQAY